MKKQFAVIGCGRFGSSIAKKLSELGNEVMVIDQSEENIQDISEFVTHAVQADATNEKTLKSLGIRNFDVVIVSIGGDIQASILVTLMVKELGVKYIISKAQNDLHAKVLYRIGADRVVFPEREMGVKVAKNLMSDNILDFIELSQDYSIIEIMALDDWVGKSLKDLNLRAKLGLNVMALKNGLEIDINIKASHVIRKDDILVVIGHNDDLKKIESK